MIVRFTRLALIFLLMLSIGLHWALLQSVAWAGMILTYSKQTSSLKTGLSMTFDGKHPCRLCVAVQEGSHAAKSNNTAQPEGLKLELFSQDGQKFVVLEPLYPGSAPSFQGPGARLGSPPPLPPPRQA